MYQFSLRTLFMSVVFVAIASAALAHPSLWWSSIWVTLLCFSLIVSTLGACQSKSSYNKHKCKCFAIAAWIYVFLVFGFMIRTEVGDSLLTTVGLKFVYSMGMDTAEKNGGVGANFQGFGLPPLVEDIKRNFFMLSGQSIFSLLVGIIASCMPFKRKVQKKHRQKSESPTRVTTKSNAIKLSH